MNIAIPSLKADFFKALAHPLRIRVLELLAEGDLSVSELREEIGVEQSHLSQQLAVLRRAGLVEARRGGTSVTYSIPDQRVSELMAIARSMMLDILNRSREGLQAS
jgi:ArsR family transcriptional regulator